MVQLVILARRQPRRHRLDALAIARSNQSRDIQRTHPPPRLVTQAIQERLQPASKLIFPIRRRAHHGRPSKKPTTYESFEKLICESGLTVQSQKSAKVVL